MMASTLSYFIDVTGPRYGAMIAWNSGVQLTELVTFGNGDLEWINPQTPSVNSGVENWGVSGEYICVKGYSSSSTGDAQWPAPATKAQIIDISSSLTVQIPLDGVTQPYIPLILPKDPFRMQVWGVIAKQRKYFWQSDFTPSITASNPVHGVLPAIQQYDYWWDETNGWVRSSGKQLPYDASGNPQDPEATSTWMNTIALGFGKCFTGTDVAMNQSFYLSQKWNW